MMFKAEALYWEPEKRRPVFKEAAPYQMSQAYYVPLPDGTAYTLWQPWVKGYNGELDLGYYKAYSFAPFVWIDQDLKEAKLGKR